MKSGSAPAWARRLALAVCAEAGVGAPEVLRWRRARREASSGLSSRARGSIAVTAGWDEADARHTLLHELAHWLVPGPAAPRRRGRRGRAVHHGRDFYATLLPLLAAHADGIGAGLRREAGRYPAALRHAAALGVPEAAGLLAERRAARTAERAARGAGTAGWRLVVPEHAVLLERDGRWYRCVTCGQRLVGRVLARAVRRGRRERHSLWTRAALPAVPPEAGQAGQAG